jgi:hypothetical protein
VRAFVRTFVAESHIIQIARDLSSHGDKVSRPPDYGAYVVKNPNTFQKRQREFDKKRKAEDKRKRRAVKNSPPAPTSPVSREEDVKPMNHD